MPYFALIIMFYHVKIACYHPSHASPPGHMAPLTGIRVYPRGLLPRVRGTYASCGPCAALPRRIRDGPACHISSAGSVE